MLETALTESGVDVSLCGRSVTAGSGQGFVFLKPDGTIASVVVGGSNLDWPPLGSGGGGGEEGRSPGLGGGLTAASLAAAVQGSAAVLLQREVPEAVNEIVAAAAARAGVPVHQDVGGEDRPISDAMLKQVCFFVPPPKKKKVAPPPHFHSLAHYVSAAAFLCAMSPRCST